MKLQDLLLLWLTGILLDLGIHQAVQRFAKKKLQSLATAQRFHSIPLITA